MKSVSYALGISLGRPEREREREREREGERGVTPWLLTFCRLMDRVE